MHNYISPALDFFSSFCFFLVSLLAIELLAKLNCLKLCVFAFVCLSFVHVLNWLIWFDWFALLSVSFPWFPLHISRSLSVSHLALLLFSLFCCFIKANKKRVQQRIRVCVPLIFVFFCMICEKFLNCNAIVFYFFLLFLFVLPARNCLVNGHRIFNCFVGLRVKFLCGLIQQGAE